MPGQVNIVAYEITTRILTRMTKSDSEWVSRQVNIVAYEITTRIGS